MPTKREFIQAIENCQIDIAKLQAMKLFLHINIKASIHICGMEYEVLNKNSIIPFIDIELKELKDRIKEYESDLKKLEPIFSTIYPND